MPGPSSWPWSGRAASSRSVSLAPSPAGATPALEQGVPEALGDPGRDGALDAVLARVTGTGRPAGDAGPVEGAHAEPGNGGGVRGDGGQAPAGVGALDGDDGSALGGVRPPDGRHHPFGVGRVGHHVEDLVVHPPDDDVVHHRGVVLVEKVGVLGPPGPDAPEVVGQRDLEPIERAAPSTRTVPRWLTSKATAPVRQARCSASVPSG